MASASDIAEVRLNTDEPTTANYDDAFVGSLVDTHGVAGAIARIWDAKAASMQKMVDVAEAGASHSMSQAFKQARQMADHWRGRSGDNDDNASGRTRIFKVGR